MNRSTIGLFSATILVVVAAVDIGIAHAVGTNTLRGEVHGTIGEFMEWQPPQEAIMPQEFVPEGYWGGTDWQVSHLVEPVAIPVTVTEESWMKDYGND